MTFFIGRQSTLKQFQQLLDKSSASFVVVYGRRRVGKSSLIEHFGKDYPMLSFEGLSPREGMTMQDQLDEFSRQFASQCHTDYRRFTQWGDAFYHLSKHTREGRMVVLLDELSWMALEDPDLPGKLKIAWDKYFKKNPKLIFFVCGSVSTWMEKNIVKSKGFHGRVSLKICLRELPLEQCKYFWGKYASKVSSTEKLKMLAVTGGIPKYLEEMSPKVTADENIRRLAFTESGILFNDFNEIFSDVLSKKSEVYERIVRLLVNGGVDSKEISGKLNMPKGRHLSELLGCLKTAGFISQHASWDLKTGKPSKVSQYRLCDNYLRFYLKYIEPNIEQIIIGNFEHRALSSLPGWSTIASLQIENLVLNNRDKIKKKLGVMPDEIIADNPYLQRATAAKKGCQIDYLIQTKFNNLYVCEIKYTRSIIRRDIIEEVEEKIKRLKIPKNTSVRPVLICLGDVHDEVWDADYFANIIKLEELMED